MKTNRKGGGEGPIVDKPGMRKVAGGGVSTAMSKEKEVGYIASAAENAANPDKFDYEGAADKIYQHVTAQKNAGLAGRLGIQGPMDKPDQSAYHEATWKNLGLQAPGGVEGRKRLNEVFQKKYPGMKVPDPNMGSGYFGY